MTKRSFVTILLIASYILAISLTTFAQGDYLSWPTLKAIYDYPKSQPPKPQITDIIVGTHHTQYYLVFKCTQYRELHTILVIPRSGKPPFPCLLFLQDSRQFKPFVNTLTRSLIAHGYAGAFINPKYEHPRQSFAKHKTHQYLQTAVDDLIQTVIDIRRLIDYLEDRPKIDHQRIGVMGTSLGVVLGTLVAAADQRIKTVSLAAGGGN